MTSSIQLPLTAFDPDGPPLCRGDHALNGFAALCIGCPQVSRSDGHLFCTRFSIEITAKEKYALGAWKRLRDRIIEREGGRCAVCGSGEHLHVHHIDGDATRDDPDNLVALCEFCHATAHAKMRRGGKESVERFLTRSRRREIDVQANPAKEREESWVKLTKDCGRRARAAPSLRRCWHRRRSRSSA